ncbi:hypothetical protein AB0E69_37280 [Kribbella sp. NPDC026611]|uniref:hypothetical protein n=1 Tax=Kribbella sp. NPDC026611 TaxID=3154911 RepID=UPI0033C327A1
MSVVRRTRDAVTLRVTDHLTAGEVVDGDGTTTALPRGTPAARLITLVGPSWRISAITLA